MNKIKNNKKLFAIILIISLLAVLLGSYAIYKSSNKDETANKIEKSEKFEKKAEKKLEQAKKSGDKEKIAKAEKELKEAEEKTEEVKNKKSTSSPSASSSNSSTSKPSSTATKPSTNSSSGATSTKPAPKPKEKKQVWVVDKPAWTETVTKYRTETKYRPTWWTYGNGTTKIHYSEEEAYNLYINDTTGEHASWGNGEDEAYTVQVPYTETINHPEQGHPEYR